MQNLHENLSQKVSWYQRWHGRDSHQYFHFIIFGVITILVGVILLGQIDSYARAFDGDESYPLAQSLNKENSRAISDLKLFETSTGAKKQAKVQELRKLLSGRKEKILERMKNGDPSLAAGFLPDEIRSRMPDTVRDLVEEKVSLSGNLSAVFVDTIKEEDSYIEYGLEVYDSSSEETTRYELLFEKGHKPLTNGSKVKVNGYKLGNKVFVAADSGQSGADVLAEPTLEETVGNKKLLVIPVSFIDNTSQPISQNDLYNAYFVNTNSTSNLIKEGSYGQVVFTGAVTPWMQINAKSDNVPAGTDCSNNKCAPYCYTSTWANLANQAATAAGYSVSSYDNVQYYLNSIPCGLCRRSL